MTETAIQRVRQEATEILETDYKSPHRTFRGAAFYGILAGGLMVLYLLLETSKNLTYAFEQI